VQYGVRNYKTHCVGMRLAPTVKETPTDLTDQGDQSKELFVQCGVFHDFTGKFNVLVNGGPRSLLILPLCWRPVRST
jgi:hypothetical protein